MNPEPVLSPGSTEKRSMNLKEAGVLIPSSLYGGWISLRMD